MSLRHNVTANYLGQGWVAFMGLAFIPRYIQHLGMEAWGLVGFMALMQTWLALLDVGLAPSLGREMARLTAGAVTAHSIRNLLRSLEVLYVGVATAVLLFVWMLAPWISTHWLHVEHFSTEQLVQAITLMGFVLASRMAEQVYRSAILGLQQIVWLNIAQSMLATLRWAGAAGVLAWVSPTLDAFFLWQAAISLLTVILFAIHTYGSIPQVPEQTHFDVEELRKVRGYAGGLALTTLLALFLTQIDKVLLSKLLSLEEFGYYSLAATLSGALYLFVSPVSTALSPRLTELVTLSKQAELIDTYHRSSQWVSVCLMGPALSMVCFAEPLLRAWTGDASLAQKTGPLLALLSIGTMLNGVLQVPYMLQLSHGWTGLAVRLNLVAVLLVVPSVWWAVPRFGSIGAASIWLMLNIGYVFLSVNAMHSRLLKTEKRGWYVHSLFWPLAIGLLTSMTFIHLWPVSVNRWAVGPMVVLLSLTTSLAIALKAPHPRAWLLSHFHTASKETQ